MLPKAVECKWLEDSNFSLSGGGTDVFTVADLDNLGGVAENASISDWKFANIRVLHVSPKTVAHLRSKRNCTVDGWT